ncbi:MAG TPA: tripartite tricarboxylate transporter substrate-binding protein [Burkholderiaceae bacterium]
MRDTSLGEQCIECGAWRLAWANSIAANPTLYQPSPFDTARDLTPIALIGRVPVVLAVNAQTPIDSIAKLIAMSRRPPDR